MGKTTTFRLKGTKTEGSYTVKRGKVSVGGIVRNTSYRPGAKSIFDDENEKSVLKPKAVVLKQNNHLNDPAVEIIVSNSNGLLLEFLKTHHRYGIDFEIFDENAKAKSESAHYDLMFEALEKVNYSDDMEIKAAALAVFGLDYFGRAAEVCKKDLKRRATEKPKDILKIYNHPQFQNRFTVSLLYCRGIIKNNSTNTAVLWSDTGNQILQVVKGENSIEKMTEYISLKGEDTEVLLQAFGEKLNQHATSFKAAEASKDDEIARLRKQLAEMEAKNKKNAAPDPDKEYTLEEASAFYKDKYGKDVPTRYTNDLEWITKKNIAPVEENA